MATGRTHTSFRIIKPIHLPVLAAVLASFVLTGCQPDDGQQAENGGTEPANAVAAAQPAEMEFPPLREFEAPEGHRVELDNGLVVYLYENDELPQVEALARIEAGQALEPMEKRGLAQVFATVLRTGGAGERGPDEVNELLEGLGAEVSTNINEDHTTVSMRTLREGVDPVLSVFADILTDPRFAADKVNLAKSRTKSAISRRNDNPQQIAFRVFGKLVFGEGSPYAWHSEYYTVDRIARDDLTAFHRAHFHPNNTRLAVVGDFDTPAMVEKIREHLGDWKAAPDYEQPALPGVEAERNSTVNFIEKTDVTQSTILVGHPGELTRDHPDYAAVEIMNEVLSGGFTGRLFKRVRSDQGLAYSVFGNYTAPYHREGQFYAGVYSKSGTTVEAARSVLKEVEKMRTEPPTEEELKLAKDAYLNSMVFNFDSLREIAGRRMTFEAYDFPADFLETLQKRIEKVTADDVHRVAQKYLHPDQAHILVVGNPSQFSEDLSVLGEVNAIDVTIPTQPPGRTKEAASAEDQAAGREMLARAKESLGGTAFDDVKAFRSEVSQTLTTPQGTFDIAIRSILELPDKVRVVQQLPMGEITIVMDGESGQMRGPQGSRPLPSRMQQQIRGQLWHDLGYLFARMGSSEMEISAEGEMQIDGKKLLGVKITPPEAKSFTVMLEPGSHRPVRMHYQGTDMQGAPVSAEMVFKNFKEVGDLTLPHHTVVYQDGEKAVEATLTKMELNPQIEEGVFSMEESG